MTYLAIFSAHLVKCPKTNKKVLVMEQCVSCSDKGIVDKRDKATLFLNCKYKVFKEDCLLNGKSSTGFCVDEEMYIHCKSPITTRRRVVDNWICQRDGILKEE